MELVDKRPELITIYKRYFNVSESHASIVVNGIISDALESNPFDSRITDIISYVSDNYNVPNNFLKVFGEMFC